MTPKTTEKKSIYNNAPEEILCYNKDELAKEAFSLLIRMDEDQLKEVFDRMIKGGYELWNPVSGKARTKS